MCPENGNLVFGPEPNLRQHIFHVHKKYLLEYLYNSQKKLLVQEEFVGSRTKMK